MSRLTDDKLDRSDLKKYTSAIVSLQKKDWHIDHICKYGIPVDHGVCVKGRIDIKKVSNLLDLFRIPGAHRFEIFPLGIPFPDLMQVRFRIGPENIGQ